jgi:hypothetical protein
MEKGVLVRVSSSEDNAELLDISLSGFIVAISSELVFLVTVAEEIADSFQVDSTTPAYFAPDFKAFNGQLKENVNVHVRLPLGMDNWHKCSRSLCLLQFPRESKKLQQVLKRSEWKTAEKVELRCTIAVFSFPLPKNASLLQKSHAGTPHQGQEIRTISSPFGIFCPDIFINSSSSGIVSMRIPSCSLFFTDSRAIPGVAGGLVQSHHRPPCTSPPEILGIELGPLQRIDGTPLDLHLCLAINPVLKALHATLPPSTFTIVFGDLDPFSSPCQCQPQLFPSLSSKAPPPALLEPSIVPASRAVVLVSAGSMWASGVVIDRFAISPPPHLGYLLPSKCPLYLFLFFLTKTAFKALSSPTPTS